MAQNMEPAFLFLLLFGLLQGPVLVEGMKQQFIFSFPDLDKCSIKLFASGKPGTQVYVKSKGTESGKFTIGDSLSGNVLLPNTVCYSQSETVSRESVQISASDDIFAVISMEMPATRLSSGVFSLLPVVSLSTKYFIATRPPNNGLDSKSVMTVTALMDGTRLTVTLKLSGGNCSNDSDLTDGNIVEKVLNKYEAYGIFCNTDMTGTMVKSSSSVAVLSGNGLVSVPVNSGSMDTVFSMMPPVEMYGTEYVLHKLGEAPGVYRVVAASTDTVVEWGNNTGTMNPGDHIDIETGEDDETCLTSTFPTLVVVFYKSGTTKPWNGTDYGDPFMTVVQATHHFTNSYQFPYITRPQMSFYNVYISLVVKTSDKTPALEVLKGGWHFAERLICNTYSVLTFEPEKEDSVLLEFSFNFGVMFFGLGYRSGLAFSGAMKKQESVSTDKVTNTVPGTVTETHILQTTTAIQSTTPGMSSATIQSTIRIQPRTPIQSSDLVEATSPVPTPFLITSADPIFINIPSTVSITMITDVSMAMITPVVVAKTDTTTTFQSTTTGMSMTTIQSTIPIQHGTPIQSPDLIDVMSPSINTVPVTKAINIPSTVSIMNTNLIQTTNLVFTPTSVLTNVTPESTMITTTTSTTTTPITSTMTAPPVTTITTTTRTPTQRSKVILDKNGQRVRAVSRKCMCFCKNKGRMEEYTKEGEKKAKGKIKKELLIETNTLTKSVSKKISAKDSRPSAYTMGWFGIAFLVLPVLLIIGVDLLNMFSYFKKHKKVQSSMQSLTKTVVTPTDGVNLDQDLNNESCEDNMESNVDSVTDDRPNQSLETGTK